MLAKAGTERALAGFAGPAPSNCLTDHQVIESVEQSLGNGVTVVYRFLGQAVDIAKVVLQTTHISIRLFPGTSEAFAKPFTARVGASATFGWSYKARPAFAGKRRKLAINDKISSPPVIWSVERT
jgi:hypothetical protein